LHIAYDITLGHPADFRVRYRFYSKDEGGRLSLPHQGYRPDFWYDYEGHVSNQVFIIWPEFEDIDGEVIIQNNGPVDENGTARMWIITPEFRSYHRDKIKIGTIGYFMEGSKRVAECEVIELLGLLR
jgi:hypothetical protein